MSDNSISIVPKLSVYPGRENKAMEILDWLVGLDIVKPILTDCVLSKDEGYPLSAGARVITYEPQYLPYDLVTNGLEIFTDRRIYDAGENGMEELICPHCGQDFANEDWEFLNDWAEGASNNLVCPLCNVGTEIHQFRFTPEWGFSDLGFTFWNWPEFTGRFIEDFKQRLGCDINIVRARI
jgi:hypothetical protein